MRILYHVVCTLLYTCQNFTFTLGADVCVTVESNKMFIVCLHCPTPSPTQRLIKKWVVQNCVEVFILHRDGPQHRFKLSSVSIIGIGVSLGVGQCEYTISVCISFLTGHFGNNNKCRKKTPLQKTPTPTLPIVKTFSRSLSSNVDNPQ